MLTIKVSGKQGEGKTTLIDIIATALVSNGYGVITEDETGTSSLRGGNGVKGVVRVVEAPVYARKPKES